MPARRLEAPSPDGSTPAPASSSSPGHEEPANVRGECVLLFHVAHVAGGRNDPEFRVGDGIAESLGDIDRAPVILHPRGGALVHGSPVAATSCRSRRATSPSDGTQADGSRRRWPTSP